MTLKCPRCRSIYHATALPSFRECRHCGVIYPIVPNLEFIRRQIEREIAMEGDWLDVWRNAIGATIIGGIMIVLLTAWWTT